MKKISSIFHFFIFCIYAFTFKTHYCYYAGTNIRFHGDCEHEIKETSAQGKLADADFFPIRYACHDLIKNAQVQKSNTILVKNISSEVLLIAFVFKILKPHFSSLDWNIPEINCRSATIPLSNSLRAPPFC